MSKLYKNSYICDKFKKIIFSKYGMHLTITIAQRYQENLGSLHSCNTVKFNRAKTFSNNAWYLDQYNLFSTLRYIVENKLYWSKYQALLEKVFFVIWIYLFIYSKWIKVCNTNIQKSILKTYNNEFDNCAIINKSKYKPMHD